MEIAGRIIGLISCLMCAIPFWVISVYNRDDHEPIAFWSGDTSLKDRVKNVKDYNREMAALYRKCAIAAMASGIAFLILPMLGTIAICLGCTAGLYWMYRCYKKILNRYT